MSKMMANAMSISLDYKNRIYDYFQYFINKWERRNDHVLGMYIYIYNRSLLINSTQILEILQYMNTHLQYHPEKCKEVFITFEYNKTYKSTRFKIVYIPKKQLQQRLFGYSNIVF